MKLRRDVALDADIKVSEIIKLSINQFYGIEYEEFPARIAEVAMLLIDHQMNLLLANEFGQLVSNIPIKSSSTIVHANALRMDWATLKTNDAFTLYADQLNFKQNIITEPAQQYGTLNVIAKSVTEINPNHNFPTPIPAPKIQYDYIIGNPPFIGKKEQNNNQKKDVEIVFNGIKKVGVLDYVACWYIKAAQFIQNTKTKVAFVSTNSISQGEQVGVLWNILFNQYNIKIHFAHRTFQWYNEAKGKAAVHCVIIGFANYNIEVKKLFDYENVKGEPHEKLAFNINPFLLEAKDITVENRKKPICNVPEMNYGSMPIDDGHLILTDEEKNEFLRQEPVLQKVIRQYSGGDEFINNKKRWCLWLIDVEPSFIRNSKLLNDRINKTRKFRLNSKREATNKLADNAMLFGEIRQPSANYIIIPKVSSENRKYIPIGILPPSIITSGSALIVPTDNLYCFGVLTSMMHMVWMKNICGRMKSDFQYSASIVYNNFPWPANPTPKQIKAIEIAAQKVLDARLLFPNNSLDEMYSINSTHIALTKAHNELDKAVDLAYLSQPLTSETKRMEFLFDLYEKYTADLFTKEKIEKTKKKNSTKENPIPSFS